MRNRSAAAASSGPRRRHRLTGDVHGGNVRNAALVREEITFGMRIVVERDEIRFARIALHHTEFERIHAAAFEQERCERMRVVDASGDEFRREHRTFAQEAGVLRHAGVARSEALQVFGEHEFRIGDHAPDAAHRRLLRERLIDHRAAEGAIVAHVRIPHAVERGEARRRQRFVDRRPAPHPGERFRRGAGILGEPHRKRRIEQIGVARTAAVMQQRDDRVDAVRAQRCKPRRGFAKIAVVRIERRDPLPEYRRARGMDAEHREPGRIGIGPRIESGFGDLIAHRLRVDARDGRLR